MNEINKPVMKWNEYDVAEWISSISREREMGNCGELFVEKGIDGQRLWDYHNNQSLKEMGIPSVGLRLVLMRKIKTIVGNDYQ